jgi:subtilisin
VCGKIAAQGVGIAPRCALTALRTLDDNGSGTVDDSTEALTWIMNHSDINLVNMSLGSPQGTPKQEKIINRLADLGVIIVAAAGNFNTDTPFYPGSYERVLTVAATDKREVKADFSNFGGQIDVAAPGVSCYGTYLGGKFRKMSGTSMATPVVTGLLALGVSYLKVVKKITDRVEISKRVLAALEGTAKDLGDKGKDRLFGFGGINGLAFLDRLSRL